MATTPEQLLTALAQSAALADCGALLAPLADYDREHNGDLVRTLAQFFACNGNARQTADRLFLHRNSLLYRLQRIEDLLAVDLRDPNTRLVLQLGVLHHQQRPPVTQPDAKLAPVGQLKTHNLQSKNRG